MSTVLLQHAELRHVLARARVVARFYAGKQVTSTAAISVVLDRLDQVALQLASARIALNNGRPRRAA
jgi:hypothetical protein